MWPLPRILGVCVKVLKLPSEPIVYAEDRLFGRFFRTPTPSSLLISGGVGSLMMNPPQSAINNADQVYLGGHKHVLTDDEVALITAAGFGDLITDEPDVQDRMSRRKPRKLG